MVGIILEGEAAVDERKRLLKEGREVPVALRERDSQGRKTAGWYHFGVGSSGGWVFCNEETEGADPRTFLELVLPHEVADLFRGYLERMMIRQCLADPSPLSAELVEVSPFLEYVVADLDAEFRIKIALP
ncbi:hypothetical protein KQI84_14400 [bacterium]|nr:hypothetical protein [bacterium]